MGDEYELTTLQVEVMEVLWSREEATVQAVVDALDRDLAQSTVATLLSRLERRGLIDHRTKGRVYVYRPLVSRSEVRTSMVEGLIDRLFSGDAAELMAHLLDSRAVDSEDLARVRKMLDHYPERESER